jgi:hypothetical protein
MTRILPWIPLATIIGLSLALAILLARPQSKVVIMTIVTPPAPVPAWSWNCGSLHSRIDLNPYWCR